MGKRRERAVLAVEPEQLEAVAAIVRSGRYESTSAFLREAIREKLARLQRERLEEQVERFCDEEDLATGAEWIDLQAVRDEPPSLGGGAVGQTP